MNPFGNPPLVGLAAMILTFGSTLGFSLLLRILGLRKWLARTIALVISIGAILLLTWRN